DLAKRVVLVTGASGGIGREIVRAFAGEGSRVIAHYRRNAAPVCQLAEELGPSCIALGADLTREAEVQQLFAAAESAFGPVEVLIANAGYWPPDEVPLEEMTLVQWGQTLTANLTSAFLCLREFFRGIRKHRLREPAAVLVGSTAGVFGE